MTEPTDDPLAQPAPEDEVQAAIAEFLDTDGDMFDRASAHLAAHPGELDAILAGSTPTEADAALDVPAADLGDGHEVTFRSALESASGDPHFQELISPAIPDPDAT